MKEFLYKILDLATFGRGMKRVINGKEVRLPTRFYRYFPDNYEKDNFRFFFDSVKPGDTVIFLGTGTGEAPKTLKDLFAGLEPEGGPDPGDRG